MCDDIDVDMAKRHKQFMDAQCAEACRHKWIISEKVGHDVGRDGILDWILKYAKPFREWWESQNGKII